MTTTLILFGIIALVGFFAVSLYNRLVALLQARKNAFADIDVQLRLRYDLVPNLIETVKGYASHEKSVLEEVTKARTQVKQAHTEAERLAGEAQLSSSLMNLFAVAESYPDLKANDNFKSLQLELSDIENKISAARRFFNSATAELNTAVQQFPANIIASMTGFTAQPFFESDVDRKDMSKAPEVKF